MTQNGKPDDRDGGFKSENQQYDFQKVYTEVKDRRCKVSNIEIRGLERTKIPIVERELARVYNASTLEEIQHLLLEAHSDLAGLDTFNAIQILVDQGARGKDSCSVVAHLEEKNWVTFHSGIYAQGMEGSTELSLRLINPTGHAEQLSISTEWGARPEMKNVSSSHSLELVKPRPFGKPVVFDARLHQLAHNREIWSSYVELLRGTTATVATEDGHHAVSLEASWRRLTDPSRCASHAVMRQLGDSLKTAVRHVYRSNTFDDMQFPRKGWGVRTDSEVAGLGFDPNLLRHVKQQVSMCFALPIASAGSLTFSIDTGIILPWGSGSWTHKESAISDRFFLGGLGAGALRGFAERGVGPSENRRHLDERASRSGSSSDRDVGTHNGRDALGGDLFCSVLAAFNFPLPFETAKAMGMHGHVFINGGSIVGLAGQRKSVGDCGREFGRSFRWSAGAGVVLPTNIGRLELNVCQILAKQQNDSARRGLQFGFTPPRG